jgi:predicted nuclease of predicted toxin-antitoxin system
MAESRSLALKFLIDECLHLKLGDVALRAGYYAGHVVRLGLMGKTDTQVFEYAVKNDLTVVTNNAADFRKLAKKSKIHAGVIILVPNVPPGQQDVLFAAAIAEIERDSEPINKVIEVKSDTVIEAYEAHTAD